MKKKGFTLIELLAVIVILAIIALIVTPIVSDIIESSKKAAAKRSVEGYIEAANNAAAVSLIDTAGINVTNDKYSFETGEDNEALSKVDISGKKPSYVYLEYDYQLLRVVLANFCYNGYAFDYDNGVIEDGAIDYCSVAFTDRPKVVVTADGELSSKVTITINYTENTVGKQYKIGNGEYADYTEPFELESSRELASQRDEHGNLKICAKATLASGESTEICRSINKLDLDYPDDPVIVANIEYPTLKQSGISVGTLNITYSQGEDITNYISFDGTNWTEYTGRETITGSMVYAKSVKNKSGLTASSSQALTSAAADGLPIEAYNDNVADTIAFGTYYLKLDDSIKGKEFEIYWHDGSSACETGFYYADENKISIGGGVTLGNTVGEQKNTYTVNSNAAYMVIRSESERLCSVREIRPVNYPVMTSTDYDYPVWTEEGNVIYDTFHINIEYHNATAQKLYKIGNGEWTNYTEPVVAPINEIVYAKSVFADGLESTTITFNTAAKEDALPQSAYNGATTDTIPYGTYYLKLSDGIKGKDFDIYWKDDSSACETYFYYADENKNSIGGGGALGNNVGNKVNRFTVNSNAKYIVFRSESEAYCTIREVRPINAPVITSDDYDYPVWTQSGIAYSTIHASISYDNKSVRKLYKIDNGEWTDYTGTFVVPLGSTVYAKSVFVNNFDSLVTKFEFAAFADAIPAELHNGDTTDTYDYGTYYVKLGDDVKGKNFNIYWYDGSSACAPSFYYANADKTSIGGGATLGNNLADQVNKYTINSNANYMVLKIESNTHCTIREIQLAD